MSQDDRERPEPVEGFNFDIRKHVVEYDDVINKQRETIYAERDKVLRNEDLTETVRAFLDEEIDVLVDSHLGRRRRPRNGTSTGCRNALARDGPRRRGHDGRRALGARRAARRSSSTCATSPTRSSRREAQEVGEDDWAMVERLVLLRTIDSLWVEHLTELDDMRRGIGLRGYAQQDPLNEFRARRSGCTRSCAASSATRSPRRSSA